MRALWYVSPRTFAWTSFVSPAVGDDGCSAVEYALRMPVDNWQRFGRCETCGGEDVIVFKPSDFAEGDFGPKAAE